MDSPEIVELQRRIAAAMDRAAAAVERMPGSDAVPRADLEEAEAAQRAAESRERTTLERAEAAEAEVSRLTEALEAEATAGAQLRERINVLKDMKDTQQSRIAELETALDELRAARSADRDELDGLIAALDPLVQEQAHA